MDPSSCPGSSTDERRPAKPKGASSSLAQGTDWGRVAHWSEHLSDTQVAGSSILSASTQPRGSGALEPGCSPRAGRRSHKPEVGVRVSPSRPQATGWAQRCLQTTPCGVRSFGRLRCRSSSRAEQLLRTQKTRVRLSAPAPPRGEGVATRRNVAQSGQRTGFGSRGSQVQVLPFRRRPRRGPLCRWQNNGCRGGWPVMHMRHAAPPSAKR